MTDPKNPFNNGSHGMEGTDAAFVIICSFIIFTMHSGFGLLESGMVSRRSEANVMVKNIINIAFGGIGYWFVGFGFSFGKNDKASKTMSGESLFITDVEIDGEDAYIYTQYFFQLSFATTATTIVSGAVAERIHLGSFMIFVLIKTSLIYTFPCHWIWSPDGWLYGKVHDFAGSMVVHMAGGAAAFAGTIILGPRLGRWKKDEIYFANSSPTNVILGTFFLWWGWIGFNCGSQFAVSGENWKMIGRVAVVTMNGAMSGCFGVCIYNLILFRWRKYLINIGELSCGILGGLVSVTAGANVIRPWEALMIGMFGGLFAIALVKLLEFLKVDDPVGCVGVHWGGGFVACITTGLFAEKGDRNSNRWNGVFRKGSGELLAWNLLGAVVVTAWSFGLTAIVFLVFKYTIGLRMSEDEEIRGSDEVEHNIIEKFYFNNPENNHAFGKRLSACQIGDAKTIAQVLENKSIDVAVDETCAEKAIEMANTIA